MGSGFSKQKKQAKMLQTQLAEMQAKAKDERFTGKSPGDFVTLVLDGEGTMHSLSIRPECVDKDDVEALQDLIIAAYTDAKKQSESSNPMPDLGGLGMGNFGGLSSLGF